MAAWTGFLFCSSSRGSHERGDSRHPFALSFWCWPDLSFVGQRYPDSKVHRRTVEEAVRSKKLEEIACEVTHFSGRKFLTVIDSGPSRFAICRPLRGETAEEVAERFRSDFQGEFSEVPSEVLCNNGPCFLSLFFASMMQRWRVSAIFLMCVGRRVCDGYDMVWFYNATPSDGTDEEIVLVQ